MMLPNEQANFGFCRQNGGGQFAVMPQEHWLNDVLKDVQPHPGWL